MTVKVRSECVYKQFKPLFWTLQYDAQHHLNYRGGLFFTTCQQSFFVFIWSVSVWVTKEFLLSAFEHSLDLIIWDSKEKVSTRARFDRPKAFRLPEGPENEEVNTPSQNNASSNVKALVLRQSISHVQLQLKESRQNKGGD